MGVILACTGWEPLERVQWEWKCLLEPGAPLSSFLALLMRTGSLWKYTVVNFFLSLGKRSMVKEQGNGFTNPQKEKCVSITPPIKRSSGSRTLWHHIKWPLSIWKWNVIQAFMRKLQICFSPFYTGYTATFIDVSQKIMVIIPSHVIKVHLRGIQLLFRTVLQGF